MFLPPSLLLEVTGSNCATYIRVSKGKGHEPFHFANNMNLGIQSSAFWLHVIILAILQSFKLALEYGSKATDVESCMGFQF